MFLFLSFNCLLGQNPGNYIELKSGNIINVGDDNIKEKEPLFRENFLLVGDLKYPISEVKGYMYKGVYYGNFEDAQFMERIVSGKINMYQIIEEYTNSKGKTRYLTRRYLQEGNDSKWKKLTNSTLKTMVKGNKKALKLVDQYQKQKRGGLIYKAGGGLVLFSGIILIASAQIFDKNKKTKSNKTIIGSAIGLGGLGGVIYGYKKAFNAEKLLFQAIEVYNKS